MRCDIAFHVPDQVKKKLFSINSSIHLYPWKVYCTYPVHLSSGSCRDLVIFLDSVEPLYHLEVTLTKTLMHPWQPWLEANSSNQGSRSPNKQKSFILEKTENRTCQVWHALHNIGMSWNWSNPQQSSWFLTSYWSSLSSLFT